MPRCFAVVISQAPGLSGTPLSGHVSRAVTIASCARSSACPTSPVRRVRPAMMRADSILQTASTTSRTSATSGLADVGREILHFLDLPHLDGVAVGERGALGPFDRFLPRLD